MSRQPRKSKLGDPDKGLPIIASRTAHRIPDVHVGDIVRLNDPKELTYYLILWVNKEEDQWWYGGVSLPLRHTYTESVWVDVLRWATHPNEYTIVGHMDLSGLSSYQLPESNP